jgi:hypothetical protein
MTDEDGEQSAALCVVDAPPVRRGVRLKYEKELTGHG